MDTPAETLDAGVARERAGTEGGRGAPDPEQFATKGAQLGRYVVLRRLGAGGMGTVYLSYDPELDRKVALKLLRGSTSKSKRRALLREAQAMAKLAHPNVVTVHDVGEHQGMVYVAMEFVEGGTLGEWLGADRRTWREVLEMFLRAGRGLQAAHARELIHRDFKPDNVMVSADGQVQVMDFGLARASHGSTEDRDVELGSLRGSVLSAATDGRLAGTPGYMAPEQVAAENLGPATDQFAFCVSLWEGLCGQRPFAGEMVAELFINVTERNVRPPPATARMPRWLRRVLLRGLEPEAAQRWPSMAELMAALERGRRRWRWQLALGVLAVMVVVAGVVVGWRQQLARERRAAVAACEAEGQAIDEIWNPRQRARLRAGLLATEVSFASDSLDTLVPWLDEYRDEWRAGRKEACLHGSVERDWDEARLDRSTWCFEDRRLQLEATVDQIAQSNVPAARRAVRLASYLDPIATCMDPLLLERLPAPPVEIRDEIRSIRASLIESDRHRHMGQYAESLEVAQDARARADALDWPPLRASAWMIEGMCLRQGGRFREADVTLKKAYFYALEAGSIEVAYRAARALVSALSTLQRYREAEVWSRHADALSPELSDPSGLDAAERHYLLLLVYEGLGDYEGATREGERALSMRAEVLGTRHPITAAASRNLGRVYMEQGRHLEALELFEDAFRVFEQGVGHDHPYVGGVVTYRGSVSYAMGRVDEALALHREGLAINEKTLRADHPKIADSLGGLGDVLLALGRLDEAERAYLRALKILRREFGSGHRSVAEAEFDMAALDLARARPDVALERALRAQEVLEIIEEPGHPGIVNARERVADMVEAMGQHEDAVRRRREALAERESVTGPDSRQLITPLVRLGDLLRRGGELAGARQSYARALSIAERVVGPQAAAVVPSLTGLAEVALAEADDVTARRHAERAVRVVEREQPGPRVAAGAHFVLARALAAAGDRAGRAPRLAQRARDESATMHDEAVRAEVDAWLSSLEHAP